ncbi:hypothetical protein Rhopal_006179-T1 [Rhodotorula paludigena]|uniref:Small nuclear ribonucleoprotein Prp3 C-terminal domain-containing protein n=1 Tax=Rhodotorula paludigena TaxID=86838 RepID=A0AAV5GSC0_9BASI|nr:hypothetical protein Rhopal_006179-T1 [Rhodotorula paludigena]
MAPLIRLDLLALQVETLELVQSLFPLDGELDIDEDTTAALPSLRSWIEAGEVHKHAANGLDPAPRLEDLAFTLHFAIERPDGPSASFPLALGVRLPLTPPIDDAHTLPDETPAATIRLQQPSWLSRGAHDGLAASLPSLSPNSFSSNADLLLQTVDFIRDAAVKLLPEPEPAPTGATGGGRRRRPAQTGTEADEPEYRVWLWFPSLSTREKRDDIVEWAPEYGISGFVMAGKPALMCLEGTETGVQAFLSDIKANSWADIPSFQKKVTERYRTPLLPSSTPSADPTHHRIFTSMSEITSLIPRTGGRANRGEMGDVRDFLAEKGLGDAFGLVIGGGQFS